MKKHEAIKTLTPDEYLKIQYLENMILIAFGEFITGNNTNIWDLAYQIHTVHQTGFIDVPMLKEEKTDVE